MSKITILGKIFYLIGAIKVYKDGDGASCIFRWYHPANWLLCIAAIFIAAFSDYNIKELMPMRLPKYWRDKKVVWLSWRAVLCL